jgi:membrane protease YdiL (CAAX protease family)
VNAPTELSAALPPRVALGLALCAAGIALLPLALLLARRLFPGRNPYFLRYGFAKVALGFALYAGLPALLAAVLPRFSLQSFVLPFVGGLCAAAYAVWLCAKMQPEGWRAIGLHGGGSARALLVGLACLAIATPAILGANEFVRGCVEWGGLTHDPQPVLLELLALEGPTLWIALVLAVLVLPFFEEVYFRGFLQPLCIQNFGDRGGIVVVSLLFMALHPLQSMAGVFLLSMVLCGVMLRTQRLHAAWFAHAAWNGGVLAVLLLWPQTRAWLL